MTTDKLTYQVTSLELSKKLKEAGYKQEGIFWWVQDEPKKWVVVYESWTNTDSTVPIKIVAPTSAELGVVLPEPYITNECKTVGNKWRIDFGDQEAFTADTEANARAKAVLWLVENGYLKFKK